MGKISGTFEHRGSSLSYVTFGEGKPLIVIHGWGTGSRVMMPLSESLSGRRTCYVVDLPGFGSSPEPPEPWGVDDYTDLIEAFIRSIGEPVSDLLVHSYGGRIALKLMARSGSSRGIGKVLITGGAGMKPKRKLSYYYRKYLAMALKAPLLLLPETLREKSLTRLRRSSLWRALGSSDYRDLSGVMRGTFVRSVNEHLDHLLPEITHEILLLWGDCDDATPLYQAKRMERGLKGSALVIIEGGGHYAFLDKPKQFTEIAKAFFEN